MVYQSALPSNRARSKYQGLQMWTSKMIGPPYCPLCLTGLGPCASDLRFSAHFQQLFRIFTHKCNPYSSTHPLRCTMTCGCGVPTDVASIYLLRLVYVRMYIRAYELRTYPYKPIVPLVCLCVADCEPRCDDLRTSTSFFGMYIAQSSTM
jgi:hypothetical protein